LLQVISPVQQRRTDIRVVISQTKKIILLVKGYLLWIIGSPLLDRKNFFLAYFFFLLLGNTNCYLYLEPYPE
jgi:hypothetical protein